MRWFKRIAAIMVLLAIAGGAAWHWRRPIVLAVLATQPEQWERERAAGEIAADAKDAQIATTPCAVFGAGPAPQVCVELLSSPSTTLDEPVRLRLRWRGLPADGYIRLAVQSAAPAGTRYRYAGPSGAITADPIAGQPDGEKIVTWDGKGVYCAPADAPMMCDAGQVGRFTIRARMLTGNDPWWPSWPAQNPVPVKWLARSDAVDIEFTGLPRTQHWSGFAGLNDAIEAAIPKDMKSSDQRGGPFDRFSPWRETLFSYCTDLMPAKPLTGRITLCFPRSRRDQYGIALRPGDLQATADLAMMPGVPTAEAAATLARRKAAKFVTVDFDHQPSPAERASFSQERRIIYLDQSRPDPRFQPDGNFWLIMVRQSVRYVGGDNVSESVSYVFRIDGADRICLLEAHSPSDKLPSRIDWRNPATLACPPGSAL